MKALLFLVKKQGPMLKVFLKVGQGQGQWVKKLVLMERYFHKECEI